MLPLLIKQTAPANGTKKYLPGSLISDFLNDENWVHSDTKKPDVNVSESEKEYKISFAVPGIPKEELKIKVEDNVLNVSHEEKTGKEENEKEHYIRREIRYGSFSRSFELPEEINEDKINASYNNGVLTVYIPKTEKKVIPAKEIKVR